MIRFLRSICPVRAAIVGAIVIALAACSNDGPSAPVSTYLEITNSSQITVWTVRVRDCGTQAWGSDLLGADIIPASLGESFPLLPGCYDVKVTADPEFPGQIIWSSVVIPAGQIVRKTVATWVNPG